MSSISREILQQVVEFSGEPLLIVRVDHPDWPVVMSNAAFGAISGEGVLGNSFADTVESLLGRDLALEISQTLRTQQETSFAVEIGGREYLLVLKPLGTGDHRGQQFYAAFWRGGGGVAAIASSELHHELLRAKRDLRDLARQDPVTGLLNDRAFREVLKHDWAVAAREKSSLALVIFRFDEFDAYIDVFGRHAADTCLRRVGQAVRRCLRRASDVVGRLDGAVLVVLSHASGEEGVQGFAAKIATAVRELGLHHPRSSVSRFVTVAHRVAVVPDPGEVESANRFLDDLLSRSED